MVCDGHQTRKSIIENVEAISLSTPDKREAIRADLAHLVATGFIREVMHPKWHANPVLVLKRIKWIGSCALTIPISTNTDRRIPLGP
jgi:hypothetical protein